MAATATPFEPTFEVDEAEDKFSEYGSEIESDTQSLAASLMEQYFEQNGRRFNTYFGPDKNPMPVDVKEQERLDIFHEMLYLSAGCTIHQAPVSGKEIQHVLDLGTGTGIWAIDFAQEYPHANVIGMDLTPIQPSWVPPNCQFEVDDFDLDWTFKQRFDFINVRFLAQCVRDWPRLLEQAKNHMSPGGWIELSEGRFELKSDDNTMPADYAAKKAIDLMAIAIERRGGINPSAERMGVLLQQAGFVNIQGKTFKVPASPWPKDPALKQAGALYATGSQSGYEAYLLTLGTRVLGYPEEEIVDLCKKAGECHLDRRSGVHAYFDYPVVWAQKPAEEK